MEVPITRESCCSCGFVFWVPASFYYERTEDHESFYCPACKEPLYYPQKTDAEKCRDEAAKLKRSLETNRQIARRLRDENTILERRRISQKGATTKLRKQLNEIQKGA